MFKKQCCFVTSEITKSLQGWIFCQWTLTINCNTNWNIINEYDKVLHGRMYFNVQVFLQKVMLCLFSLSIIQFSCSCLVKMCQFNCRSTSSQTVPLSSFDIQEEQLNCIKILKRKTFLFLKFSIIISTIVEAERGENPFPNPLCARRGEKGEGDADGQVLLLSDWFTRTSPVIPLFHYATTAEQYHSTTLVDLPEPSHTASYMIPVLFPTTIPQSVPHSTAPYQIYKPTNQKRQKQGSKTLFNLPEPAQRQTWYHISTSLP